MDVKYQIFVSSTYADLVDERRSVIESVLNLGHIPVGMEAFQASDDTQWDYIKRRIDDSDYYVLIVAERYGSELKGKSYTQMEYEYAVAQGVSTVAFLLEGGARKTWAAEKVEFEKKAKLERFRKLYEKELVKYWRNKDDLAGKVAMAIRRYDRGLSGGPPLVFAAVKQTGVARERRAEPQAKKGRAMEQDNVFYVGVDVSKAKHAVAIAEGGRGGEVRYFGEAFPARRHRNVVAVKPNRDGPSS
jgi:hypothetical protein